MKLSINSLFYGTLLGLFNIAAACCPSFPPQILDSAGKAVQNIPPGSFEYELNRMGFHSNLKFKAVPVEIPNPWDEQFPEPYYSNQNYRMGVADFEAWLNNSNLSTQQRDELLQKFVAARKMICDYKKASSPKSPYSWDNKKFSKEDEEKLKKFNVDIVSDSLPAEFRDYLKGSVCWYMGKKTLADARRYWQMILALPSNQRKYRSTWAAYMLGRSMEDTNPTASVKWYQTVRELARQGYVDSLGLAAASIGREARLELKEKHYEKALDLYLSQYLTGDRTAVNSLKMVLGGLIFQKDIKQYETAEPKELADLIKNPVILQLCIAYIVSYSQHYYSYLSSQPEDAILEQFFKALTLAGYLKKNADGKLVPVKTIPQGDRLAWIAYRGGKFDLAEKFLATAPDTDVSHWLRAKIFFRNGQRQQALVELQNLTKPSTGVKTVISYPNYPFDRDDVGDFEGMEKRVSGELGCLLLSRNQYVEAMDILFRNRWYEDASYLAERILTPDELLEYVAKNFPQAPQHQNDRTKKYDSAKGDFTYIDVINLRYLLARRLTRIGRWKEARQYYPTQELQDKHKQYIDAIRNGKDFTHSKSQRAKDLFTAGKIAKQYGMELMGTEHGPDFTTYRGAFGDDKPLPIAEQAKLLRQRAKPLPASVDEKTRFSNSAALPNERFHYRYIAADYAWQAAELMPDNDAQTADALYEAGCWLKDRDPQAADRFYKALVNRCGQTPLGRAADETHWFPSTPQKEK